MSKFLEGTMWLSAWSVLGFLFLAFIQGIMDGPSYMGIALGFSGYSALVFGIAWALWALIDVISTWNVKHMDPTLAFITPEMFILLQEAHGGPKAMEIAVDYHAGILSKADVSDRLLNPGLYSERD